MKLPLVAITRKKTVVTDVYVKLSVNDAILLAEVHGAIINGTKVAPAGAYNGMKICYTVAGRAVKFKQYKGKTYLTTNPNSIKDDNLEALPEFDKIGKLAVIKYKAARLRKQRSKKSGV